MPAARRRTACRPRRARRRPAARRRHAGSTPAPVFAGSPYPISPGGWVFPLYPLARVAARSWWSLDAGVDLGGNANQCGARLLRAGGRERHDRAARASKASARLRPCCSSTADPTAGATSTTGTPRRRSCPSARTSPPASRSPRSAAASSASPPRRTWRSACSPPAPRAPSTCPRSGETSHETLAQLDLRLPHGRRRRRPPRGRRQGQAPRRHGARRDALIAAISSSALRQPAPGCRLVRRDGSSSPALHRGCGSRSTATRCGAARDRPPPVRAPRRPHAVVTEVVPGVSVGLQPRTATLGAKASKFANNARQRRPARRAQLRHLLGPRGRATTANGRT